MKISPQVEESTRELLGHAIHGDLEKFQQTLTSLDHTTLDQAAALAMSIAGAVAVHVCEANPPSDEALWTLATTAEKVEKRYQLGADEVHKLLAQCVFGSALLTDVFDAADAVRLPFAVAGNLLGSYAEREKGQKWTDYLDQVEAALEAAPDRS